MQDDDYDSFDFDETVALERHSDTKVRHLITRGMIGIVKRNLKYALTIIASPILPPKPA